MALRTRAGQFAWLMAVCGAVLALFWPATRELGQLWLDEVRSTYTHGFLVAAVAAWLLWKRLPRESAFPQDWPAPYRGAFAAALLACVFLWLLFFRAGLPAAYLLLVPVILALAVAALFGPAAWRAARLPIAFLLFAVPTWDYLSPPAQSASIYVARFLLRSVSVPAYFDGNLVQVPDGVFAIEGGCSGLHYIIVALAVATLLGELRGDSWRMRLRWLAIALLLALLANWLRVFSIIVIGHMTHMQSYLVRVSHYGYGWVVFAVALAALFVIERRAPPGHAQPGSGRVDTVAASPPAAGGPAWRLAVCLILCLPPLLNLVIDHAPAAEASLPAQPPPVRGWQASGGDPAAWPAMPAADERRQWEYRAAGEAVLLYMALHREQRSGNALDAYRTLSPDPAARSAAGYSVGGRTFARVDAAQLWYSLRTLLTLRSQPATAWVVRAPCQPDCDAARAVLARFTAGMEGMDEQTN